MVQGLPFDFLGSEEGVGTDYTLETLIEEDDEDVPLDEEKEGECRDQLQHAHDERARLIDEVTKSVAELTISLKLDCGSPYEMDERSRQERDRIKERNVELCKIRDQIKHQESIACAKELELLGSKNKRALREIKHVIKEKEIERVHQVVLAAETVDLAFILDATGSMSPHIENVKTSIQMVVTKVRRTNRNLNLRLAVVAYRDLGDVQRFEVLDFVTDIAEFEQFLSRIESTGGADTPEDMAGGIKQGNELSWSSLTRVAFLIADAPCHGTEFHSYDDNYPSGTPGIDIQQEICTLMENRGQGTMSVFFGRLCSGTDQMIQRLRNATYH